MLERRGRLGQRLDTLAPERLDSEFSGAFVRVRAIGAESVRGLAPPICDTASWKTRIRPECSPIGLVDCCHAQCVVLESTAGRLRVTRSSAQSRNPYEKTP